MTDQVKRRKLYIAAETTYAQEAGAANGSAMAYVEATSIGQLVDGKGVIEAPQMTGRPFPTAMYAGPDGGQFDIEFPIIGLSGSAPSGSSIPAVDWFDTLMRSFFGTADAEAVGTGIAAFSSGSVTFPGGHGRALQDVMCFTDVGAATRDRSFPVLIVSQSGVNQFGFSPILLGGGTSGNVTPTTSWHVPGYRKYVFNESGTVGNGTSFTATVVQDSNIYTMRGCRPTAFSISIPSSQIAVGKMTIGYDSKTDETATKTALPVARKRPFSPCQGFANGLWVNGTRYDSMNMEVNFNPGAQNVGDQTSANGRGSIDIFDIAPEATVNPLFSTGLLALKRAMTEGPLLIQIGSGQSGSFGTTTAARNLINMVCIAFPNAQVTQADPSEDDKALRSSVTIKAVDQVIFSGSTVSDIVSLTRF